ncbi:MAG TPA: response regulator transcription factor [Rubrobacteraceae bacterium]|nr:response regulator transcription factor [Rubrobacteraceae bacterium]
MGPKILLVEDDAVERELLRDVLRGENMYVEAVEDSTQALDRCLDSDGFDLLLLDTDLAGIDGFSICRELRARTSIPIVMLSVRDDETSVVDGLEVGADDYLTKPFSVRELTSRIRAHLRRQRRDTTNPGRETLRFPDLEIDLMRYRVLAQGNPVELSAAQFKILALLASNPGRVYSREQIMEPIWGSRSPSNSRAADVHIQNIRRKIEPDPGNPRHIQTVRGTGYRLAEARD